jgi:NAD(P)-dependent dehydrogenase (short-subunit alcohol dehydrogenase family)
MITLEGKVAIVIGGASGIGAATAHTFGQLGAAVVVADIDVAGADRRADEIRSAGGQALGVRADVAEEADVAAMVRSAVDTFGRLDIIHNNAAAIGLAHRDEGILELDPDLWTETFRVNTIGVGLGCKHAIPAMLENGGGAIVNTSSISADRGEMWLTAYGASKAAVSQLTRSVAAQWSRRGIRCNAVAPGLTLTETTKAGAPAEMLDLYLEHCLTPFGGDPQDLANVVAFLASDAARYVTGQVLAVDGGVSSTNPTWAGQRAYWQAARLAQA